MGADGRIKEAEDSLAIRAAWLHYAGGLTQAEVAARLGVSPVKAHRLVTRANRSGAVRVTVDGAVVECLELESRLADLYGMAECRVAPDLHEPDLPLRALGAVGATLLSEEIARPGTRLIGLGHGRTLCAAIAGLPRAPVGNVRFVSLMGGLTRHYAANPHDVMHRLTLRTGADAYVLPVPFFANSAQDRAVLLAQRGVADVVGLGMQADMMLVGIGTVEPDAQLVASRMIEAGEIAEISEKGGVGEMLGHFFDAEGDPVRTPLTARTLSPDLAALSGRRLVAIAGGARKTEAIRAILKSGVLTGLVTDEATARDLAGG